MNLADLHDKYEGERLFVLGTGPSIKSASLSLLEREYTFGVNTLMRFLPMPFAPTFYGVSEDGAFEDPEQILSIHMLPPKTVVFLTTETGGVDYPAPVKPIAVKMDMGNDMRDAKWNAFCRMDTGFMNGYTPVFTLGVQMGYWMGFRKIYLLGCENTTEDARRPMRQVELVGSSAKPLWNILQANGIELFDCTEGGTLNKRGLIPYKSLQDALEKPP